MTFSMLKGFALKNLKANRIWNLPFVISSTVMLILFYIMASLRENRFVQQRHPSLPYLITYGILLVGLTVCIFILYAVSFLLKKRHKEFALYGILGLEKKHIRKIIGMEFCILFSWIGLFGMIGGFIFGKLTFLGLNFLMKETGSRLMDYPFSLPAAARSLLLLLIVYLVSLARIGVSIHLSTPIQLLTSQHKGEAEPKSRYFLSSLGLLFLGAGYYIALTAKGTLSSLLLFFLAALLVMLATYLLYMSFSVILLKARRRSAGYYKPANFLGVSGLLYRVRGNAVSLASIAVLSVGVLITVSAAAAIYANIQTMAANSQPRAYQMENPAPVDEESYERIGQELSLLVEESLPEKGAVDALISYTATLPVHKEGTALSSYGEKDTSIPSYVLLYDLASYNKRTGQSLSLSEDEILLCKNQNDGEKVEELSIGERSFRVRRIENIIPSNYAVEVYGIVVRDMKTLLYISRSLKEWNIEEKRWETGRVYAQIDWDTEGVSEKDYRGRMEAMAGEKGYELNIRSEYLKLVYEMNGGFLFLGMVTGLDFLTGMVLIAYYKQISGGYADREMYQTMKRVGLSDTLIKKTIASQIVWMFYGPLGVAVLHGIVGSRIVYQLLGLFGITSYMQYGRFFLLAVLVFGLIYFILFQLTSRVYYRIVNR